MNRVHAREPLGIKQSAKDDLRNRSHAVVWTEEISGARFVGFGIDARIFMLHERIPDSGRHFHLVGSKRLQAKLESFALALRIPDFERLLSVTSNGERNLGSPNGANGGGQGITMKEVHKGESRREFRNGLALVEHPGSIGCDQRVANRKHFAQPGHRIRAIIISIPARIVVVAPEDPSMQRSLHNGIESRNLLWIFSRPRRLSGSTVSPLDGELV